MSHWNYILGIECPVLFMNTYFKKRFYWTQQEFLWPFFAFSLALGRYFSRKANCFAFIAPLLLLKTKKTDIVLAKAKNQFDNTKWEFFYQISASRTSQKLRQALTRYDDSWFWVAMKNIVKESESFSFWRVKRKR